MSQVWPGIVVEENNLQVHISAVRKALEEGSGGDSFVVTVPGRGYRLIGLQSNGLAERRLTEDAARPAVPGTSIAVRPFSNQWRCRAGLFCGGIMRDIITGLSRISWLFRRFATLSLPRQDLVAGTRAAGCRYLCRAASGGRNGSGLQRSWRESKAACLPPSATTIAR